jgi:hypothetical protein
MFETSFGCDHSAALKPATAPEFNSPRTTVRDELWTFSGENGPYRTFELCKIQQAAFPQAAVRAGYSILN